MSDEICANCQRKIGKLEQAYVYQNNIVCKPCYGILNSSELPSANNTKNIEKTAKATSSIASLLWAIVIIAVVLFLIAFILNAITAYHEAARQSSAIFSVPYLAIISP